MFDSLVVSTSAPGALKEALNEAGWVDGEILAAGQLRQGKATGGSPENDAGNYQVRVQPGEHSSWARSEMRLVDLADGENSKGGTMVLKGERFPVARPNVSGDPSTDELIALLAADA